jgi:dihydroorotase
MSHLIIKNVLLVNEGITKPSDILIIDSFIQQITPPNTLKSDGAQIIDGSGKYLLPGMIDDQVHFREPGLTHKATIYSEAKAAVAGGITSFMEMPNTVPNTLTQELLAEKYSRAAESSIANYSFFMGAGNDNLTEVLKTDKN